MDKIVPGYWGLRAFLALGVIGIVLLPATIVQYNDYVKNGYGTSAEFAGATWGENTSDYFLNLTFNVSNSGKLDAVVNEVSAELFYESSSIGQHTYLIVDGEVESGGSMLAYLKVRAPKNQLPPLSAGDVIRASGYIEVEVPYREITLHLAFDEIIELD